MAITTIVPVALTAYNTFVAEGSTTDFAALDGTLGAKVPLTKRDEQLLICVKQTPAAGSTLLSITTAPETCAADDLYYKAADSKIYTATDTNTWGETGAAVSATLIYVFDGKFYMAITADEVTTMTQVYPKAIIKAGSYLQNAMGDSELILTPSCIAWVVVESGRHLNSDGYVYISSDNGLGTITATVSAMAVNLP